MSRAMSDDRLTKNEIEQRRDDAIRRALNTPPPPKKPKADKSKVFKARRSKPKGDATS